MGAPEVQTHVSGTELVELVAVGIPKDVILVLVGFGSIRPNLNQASSRAKALVRYLELVAAAMVDSTQKALLFA